MPPTHKALNWNPSPGKGRGAEVKARVTKQTVLCPSCLELRAAEINDASSNAGCGGPAAEACDFLPVIH